MKVLITGVCGFVGSAIARFLIRGDASIQVCGIDNLVRRGSETNVDELTRLGVRVVHGDLRNSEDLAAIGSVQWVIDAAALPSVLGGVNVLGGVDPIAGGAGGLPSSRQVVGHNLIATLNVLEYCRCHGAGLVLLSTSRVYSIASLRRLSLDVHNDAFVPNDDQPGITSGGIDESFSTEPPVSLYGATKLASETMAREFGLTYGFPVWINRCGVIAGAGQFGRADQGIFSYWIHSHLRRRPLSYIGFGGSGHQVRDCLHPDDLAQLIQSQIQARPDSPTGQRPRIANVGGGGASAMSLRQLTQWCDARFGKHPVQASDQERPFDVPWLVLDASLARSAWSWSPAKSVDLILNEIAEHAEANPNWLEMSR